MGATFRHEFKRLLGQVWAWGGSFFLLAWWGYQRRDLRVSGEGSWKMPGMGKGK